MGCSGICTNIMTGALGTMVRTLHLGVIFHAPSRPIIKREGMDSQGVHVPPDLQSYFITRLQVKYTNFTRKRLRTNKYTVF